jgi:lipoic acid synthetase
VATPSHQSRLKKPSWLKVNLPTHENYFRVASLVREKHLHTICQSAKCPNVSECWTNRTATFLILGDVCTRDCSFCAVPHGKATPVRGEEAAHVAESVAAMDLRYAVVTSVTRDDLPDGGASHFAAVIEAIRSVRPDTLIEVLVPDFLGDPEALQTVIEAGPEVLNHNLETPERLYPEINRPRGSYSRSLQLLRSAKKKGAVTKSGLMVGLGEHERELIRTFKDLRQGGCNLLTIGQYLQATKNNSSVVKYYAPSEFSRLKTIALEMGFSEVEAGPLVRSSYRAHRMYRDYLERKEKTN